MEGKETGCKPGSGVVLTKPENKKVTTPSKLNFVSFCLPLLNTGGELKAIF